MITKAIADAILNDDPSVTTEFLRDLYHELPFWDRLIIDQCHDVVDHLCRDGNDSCSRIDRVAFAVLAGLVAEDRLVSHVYVEDEVLF